VSGDQPGIRARDAAWVGGASALAGLTGLVVMVWLTEVLDAAEYADFMVFWSLLFWVAGTFGGMQYESVRSVTAARGEGRGVRVVPLMAVLAVGLLALFWASSPLWSGRVLAWSPGLSAAVIAVGAAFIAVENAVVGTLGGLGRWRVGAVVVTVDTMTRFLPFLIIPLLAAPSFLYRCAAAAGGLGAVACLMSSRVRSSLKARADSGARRLATTTLRALGANLAACAFLVGYPTLMSLVLGEDVMRDTAGLLFAISLTRAPLIMPINAFQSMFVSSFVRAEGRRRRVALRLLGLVLAGGIVLSALLALVGPPLLRLLRPAYHLGWPVIAGLTLGATSIGLVAVTGSLALASQRHTRYMLGWLAAIAVSLVALAVPGDVTTKVVASLIVGPLVGAAVHLAAALGPSTGAPYVAPPETTRSERLDT
jgi:O-antigen/teichoic acid export membrane protein